MLPVFEIKNFRKARPDHRKKNFLSDYEYEIQVKNIIWSYLDKGFCEYLTKNEDLIANLKYAAMEGDWLWDANHVKGQSRGSFRISHVLWAAKKIAKALHGPKFRVRNSKEWLEAVAVIKTKPESINNVAVFIERENNNVKLEQIFQFSLLTDLQKEYLRLHFIEGLTGKMIAYRVKKTPQGVYEVLRNAIETLKQGATFANVDSDSIFS